MPGTISRFKSEFCALLHGDSTAKRPTAYPQCKMSLLARNGRGDCSPSCPLLEVYLPRQPMTAETVDVEWPGGISPPGSPRTVREPLDSYGSHCSAVGTPATGFASSTGSSCCQLASVG